MAFLVEGEAIPKRHSSDVIPNEEVKHFWRFGAGSPNDVAVLNSHMSLDKDVQKHVELMFTQWKIDMTMENQPFEDISPTSIKTGDFLASHVFFFRGLHGRLWCSFVSSRKPARRCTGWKTILVLAPNYLVLQIGFKVRLDSQGLNLGFLFVKVLALSKSGSYSDYVVL